MTHEEINQLAMVVQRPLDNITATDVYDQRQLNAADIALHELVELALRAAELETELAGLNAATTVWSEMLHRRL